MTREALPPEPEMPRVYQDWLEFLSLAEGKKPATLKAYGAALRRILVYAEIRPSLFGPSSLDQTTLADAVHSMRFSGLSPSTIRLTLTVVQNFCEFCQWQGLIDGLPNFRMVRRRIPRVTRSNSDYYRPGEMQDLFATAAEPSRPHRVRWPERDTAMLCFLPFLGLRGQELCDANCDWVRHERYVDTDEAWNWTLNWTLHIQGEGPRRRQVPAPNWILLEVSERWEQSRSERFRGPWPEGPLFVTNDGERFTLARLRYLLKVLQQDAEIRPLPLKAFRRSAQIQWENLGLTALQIRRLLGNSKLD